MTDRNAKRPYDRATLSAAVRACRTWTELMRYLGLGTSGGQRRVLQRKVAAHGIDTSHFTRRSPWRLYSDTVLAEAAASSTTLRETALELGATPAPGTLSHIRRRIDAAGIDISHFPHINRAQEDLPPFTDDELHRAAASSKSIRETARTLGLPEDARSRAALRLALRERHVDTSHFRHARLSIPEDRLRAAVTAASSYADVMRALDLEVNDTNHRRVRRAAARFGLDTGHFTRRARGTLQVVEPVRTAENVLVVLPHGPDGPTGHVCTRHCGRSASRISAFRAGTPVSGWVNRSPSTSTTSTATGKTTERGTSGTCVRTAIH